MSDGGKGSKPRPISISIEDYDNQWNNIFKKTLTEEPPKETTQNETKSNKKSRNIPNS